MTPSFMDAIMQAAEAEAEAVNVKARKGANVIKNDPGYVLYDIGRAKKMKSYERFFYFYSILNKVANKLNERRSPCAEETVYWCDIVGDRRHKQQINKFSGKEDGENKIPLIDLLSDITASNDMNDEEKKKLVKKLQKWIKTIRLRSKRNELTNWQRNLFLAFTKAHGISIISGSSRKGRQTKVQTSQPTTQKGGGKKRKATEQDRHAEETKRSRRSSKPSQRSSGKEDAESGSSHGGEGGEGTKNLLSQDEEQEHFEDDSSEADNSTEGNAATASSNVQSEQHQGQETNGSKKRTLNNGNSDDNYGSNDSVTNVLVSGVKQHDRSKQDAILGNETVIAQHQQQQIRQQQQHYMGSPSGFSSLDHQPYQDQWNDYYYQNHSFLNPSNWARGHHPYYGFEGRNMAAMQGGFVLWGREESSVAAQANNERGLIQEGGNQNDVATWVEMSDSEDQDDGEEKQSPVAGQKKMIDGSKQQSETSTSNNTGDDGPEVMNEEIVESKGTNKDGQSGVPEQPSLRRSANLKGDNERGKSDTILQKRASEEDNLNDGREHASDVMLMLGGEGVAGDATEDSDMRGGGDDHNEMSLAKQLEDMKHKLRHKEDAMAKEEAERKRLHSSFDVAKRAHAAQIQDINSQLKTKSDDVETLISALIEEKASKAEVESQLQLKTTELKEMTEKVSDAEKRVKSVGEKLTHELQTKRNEVSQLSANVENMKGQQEDALKREEALKDQLECLQSQMEILQDSKINFEQEKATNDALLRTWQNEANEISNIAERLSAKLKSKEVAMKEMSTEIAALNAKLVEHARGSDAAQIMTEIGALREALGMANMKISKQEEESDILTKKFKELEEATKHLPKRVQPSRQSKTSDEPLAEPSRNSKHGRKKDCNEEDAHLVQIIKNDIVDNGQKVEFDDIAGLEYEKEAIKFMAIYPLKRPELFTGLRACPKEQSYKGLLLFGPPGTGKTMIGKAIAHESKATFFSMSASSFGSKYHGEGEKLVKYLFVEASTRAPSVVFIDEVDSLLSQRKSDEDEASRKIKTEFLNQFDGVRNVSDGRVLVIGATNCPQDLDDAARRRFAKRLYVPLPDKHGREALLRNVLRDNSHSLTDSEFEKLASDTEGFSGADMQILCDEVVNVRLESLLEIEEDIMHIDANEIPPISYEHFRQSLSGMNASVSLDSLQMYIDWNNTYGSKVGVRKKHQLTKKLLEV